MNPQFLHEKPPNSASSNGQIFSIGDREKIADAVLSKNSDAELTPPSPLPSVDRIVMRRTDSLNPHPSLADRGLLPSIERLQQLEKHPHALFKDPLLITKGSIIVDGHARWLSARHLQVMTLPCIECDLSEQEALERILQTQRHTQWPR
jgi:hypothetical protein